MQSGAFAAIYLGIWFICNKKLKKGIIKAILIGLATPFFFYNFAIRFASPINYFLHITGILPDRHGVLTLIVAVTAKPLSIILGIIITLILLVEDDFMNELRK